MILTAIIHCSILQVDIYGIFVLFYGHKYELHLLSFELCVYEDSTFNSLTGRNSSNEAVSDLLKFGNEERQLFVGLL